MLNASEGTRLTVGIKFDTGDYSLWVQIENIRQGTSILLHPDDWDTIADNVNTILTNMTIEFVPYHRYEELRLFAGSAKIVTMDDYSDAMLLIGSPTSVYGHVYLDELSVAAMPDLYDAVWGLCNQIGMLERHCKTAHDKIVACVRERKACVHELIRCIGSCVNKDLGITPELVIAIRGEFTAYMKQLFASYCTPQSKCDQCD